MSVKVKAKRGRPANPGWKKITNLVWVNSTDAEIAAKVGCSHVNVFLMRKRKIAKAIAEAKANGEDEIKAGARYVCKRGRFARSKKTAPKA